MNSRTAEPLPNAYEAHWRRFRVLNYLGIAGLILFVGAPTIAAFVFPSIAQFFVEPNNWTLLYIALSIALLVGCGIRQQLFRCPRCANYFFRETLMSVPPTHSEHFRKHQCVHCGLKLYASTK